MWSPSLLLLFTFLSGLKDSSGSERVTASEGENAVLPCHTDIKQDQLTVEWIRKDLKSETVFAYRQGCEIYAEKNQDYEFRTNLFMNELKHGNISLSFSNLKVSDGGNYTCRTIKNGEQKDVSMELVVAPVSVSEPRLSILPALGDGSTVTLQCESGCWFPKPEMTFLDEHGNILTGIELNPENGSSSCFNITKRVKVDAAVRRVVCRAELPGREKLMVVVMNLPVFHSDGGVTSWSVIITIIAVVEGMILLGLFVWNRVKSYWPLKPPIIRQSSDRREPGDDSGGCHGPEKQDDPTSIRVEPQETEEEPEHKLLDKDGEKKGLLQQPNNLRLRLVPAAQDRHSPEPASRDEAQQPKPQTSSCSDRIDDDDDYSPSSINPRPTGSAQSIPRSKSFSQPQVFQKAMTKRRYTASGVPASSLFKVDEEERQGLIDPKSPVSEP